MPRTKSTHVDDPVAAGRRIREARERVGISQRRLAFPGCSAAYISRIESGQRIASLQILRELARRLDVTEEYLATGGAPAAASMLEEAEVALRLDDAEEAARGYQEALDVAPDDETRSRALEGLGHVASRHGDPARAVQLFEQALVLDAGRLTDRPSLAESLARSYAALGKLAQAIATLERCVEASANDPVQYVRFAGLLGAALTDSGSFVEAERVLAAALERGREVADPYTRARLYWSESRLRGEQGQPDVAERFARRTLEILRTTEDEYAIAHVLQSLGSLYLDLDRGEEALEVLDEGRGLITATGTPLEIAQYRLEEARALAAVGEREAAAALAMRISAELEGAHPVDAGRAYALLGEIFLELGESERAREILELAVEQLENQAPGRYLFQTYRRLARLRKESGDVDGALELLERATGVQEAVGRALA